MLYIVFTYIMQRNITKIYIMYTHIHTHTTTSCVNHASIYIMDTGSYPASHTHIHHNKRTSYLSHTHMDLHPYHKHIPHSYIYHIMQVPYYTHVLFEMKKYSVSFLLWTNSPMCLFISDFFISQQRFIISYSLNKVWKQGSVKCSTRKILRVLMVLNIGSLNKKNLWFSKIEPNQCAVSCWARYTNVVFPEGSSWLGC